MKRIIEMLHAGGYSCVIENEEIRTFTQRGVADLYELLNTNPSFLKKASVADKVIGKAAAALLILGGIKRLYTDVISTFALNLLSTSGIEVTYGKEVPFIENRTKTGWCPLETLCKECNDANDILLLIEEFIKKK